ncbi:MAG: DUF169 domain-containing protein [Oscillospiraceae bacterium]|nr:DUF169 domain-containing protein [Oscillospiraceae bacterium]
MMREKDRELIKKLDLPYPAVAIKLRFEPPGVPRYDGPPIALCQFVKYTQDTGKHFYIGIEDEACVGKMVLGMEGKPPVTASGQAGYDFGCYKAPVAAQQLYQRLPILEPHTVNYVEYCPAAECNFDPDLLYFVADFPQADIIMRATSYISGDLWESVSSPIISCAWMIAHPIISGKVNHITTGFYHGLKRRKAYPQGLRMISVPFRKLPEFFQALEEMDWELIAFRDDEDSKAELKRRMDHWQELAEITGTRCDLKA